MYSICRLFDLKGRKSDVALTTLEVPRYVLLTVLTELSGLGQWIQTVTGEGGPLLLTDGVILTGIAVTARPTASNNLTPGQKKHGTWTLLALAKYINVFKT